MKDQIYEAYEVSGTLKKRMEILRVERALPQREALEAFKKGVKIVEERTKEVFPDMLPKGEQIELNPILFSDGINWVSYNWYQGNFKSIVDVTLDFGMYWTGILRTSAHECYPGHHTQFVVAEDKLFNERNHFEQAILLQCNPYIVICEGIADISLNSLFSAQEQEEIALREFCPDPLKGPSVDLLVKQNCARKKIPMIKFNATYHAHVDSWSEKEVKAYVKSFELWDSKSLNNMTKLIFKPHFRTSEYAYQIGTTIK
ncbi:MAG: hypothetical protein CEE42_02165 [Promethearchaeota archaeon Loki_b31]|nr:MAG: hypothetical protein CEE42_02165 [Candidatus Lokiarchaeota archaeon Loki_b31]